MIAKVKMALEVDLMPTLRDLLSSLDEMAVFLQHRDGRCPQPDELTAKFMLGRQTGHTRCALKLAIEQSSKGKIVFVMVRNRNEQNEMRNEFQAFRNNLLRQNKTCNDIHIAFSVADFRGMNVPDLFIVDGPITDDFKQVQNALYNRRDPVKYLILQ